jgi:erythromycin esterase
MRYLLLMIGLAIFCPTMLPAQTNTHAVPPTRLDSQQKSDSDVILWLRQHALPIKHVGPGGDFDDLQPLKPMLQDVRVVGLGEATHGTREFFLFKHRLVEFLVREMNFRAFAIEAGYASCVSINDYVSGGKITRAQALQSLAFPVWQTEEVAALIDWLRAYNQSVPPERKVQFVGYDMQDSGGPWEVIRYLQNVAPGKASEVMALVKSISSAIQGAMNGSKDPLKALQPQIDNLISYFTQHEADFVSNTSRSEYEEKLHRLRLLAQCADVFSRDWDETRDRYMADNICYILTHQTPGARVAVWAHNAHISTGDANSTPGGGKAMGAFLRQRLGSQYYALGFSFSEGSFQAMTNTPGGGTGYAQYSVGPAGKGTLNWYFAQAGIGNYIIDFRHTPKDESVRQWLASPQPFCWVGGYNVPPNIKELWAAGNFLKSALGKEFDGIAFIQRTTRSQPLPKEEMSQPNPS